MTAITIAIANSSIADLVHDTWTGNEGFGRTYLPGHVLGKPWIYLPGKEDGNGVIAGTTNHIAPVDWTQLVVEGSRIVEINAGGEFGEKLRKLKSETDHLPIPASPARDCSTGGKPRSGPIRTSTDRARVSRPAGSTASTSVSARA